MMPAWTRSTVSLVNNTISFHLRADHRWSLDEVGADPKDADNFTLLAADNHKHFPKTYICYCEGDPLRDDSKTMLKALDKAGVQTKSDYYPGLPHYFWIFPGIPQAGDFMANIIGATQWVLS